AEFQRAMKIRKTPRVEAQVALAEQALGIWDVAEEDLLAALAESDDPWIRKNRTALNRALETIRANLGTLDVWGKPEGAEVFINEKPVGTLPLKQPIRVFGESAVVRVRATGYFEATRTPRVLRGQTVREYVELVAVPPSPPVVATAPDRPD